MAAVLTSWKEIAVFFGKGVRTVQRWEETRGLPIHRLPDHKMGTVFAYPEELRAWISALQKETSNGTESGSVTDATTLKEIQTQIDKLLVENKIHRDRMVHLLRNYIDGCD